jgi:hypothetical protein
MGFHVISRCYPPKAQDLNNWGQELPAILKKEMDLREAALSDKITQGIGSMEQRLKDQIAEAMQALMKTALLETLEVAVEDFMRDMLGS